MIGADLNGRVGEGNRSDEELKSRCGVRCYQGKAPGRTDGGKFCRKNVNDCVEDLLPEEGRTQGEYQSRGWSSQVDHIRWRQCNLRENLRNEKKICMMTYERQMDQTGKGVKKGSAD